MIGQTVSHYKILDKLGEGGMGVVYRAHDTKLDREVALKFLPPYLASEPVEKERFLREARAASALNHPNITTVHEIDEYYDQIFMAMELVEGKTLKQLVKAETLPVKKVLDIAIQACEGLMAAAEKGVVHRDIKSDNIILTPKNQVKIMDFGLAKFKGDAKLTAAGSTVGTAAYMSPEQATGEEVDQRADIFSFGVVLYELLTGKLPFRGEHPAGYAYAILNEQPEPLARFNDKVTPELQRIVSRALQKDKQERYQHIDDLAAELRHERKNLEYAKAPTPSQLEAISKPKKNILKILVPTSAVVVLAILFFIFNPFKVEVSRDQSAAASQNTLAVMYFENIPDPEDKDHTGEMLTNLLITALFQTKGLEVISRERLYDIQKELGQAESKSITPSLATQIAQRAGVSMMLLGTILQQQPSLTVTFRLIEVKSGKILSTQRLAGFSAAQVFPLVDSLTALVQNDLKVPPSPASEIKSVAEVTTSSIEAYRSYLEGIELGHKFYGDEARAAFKKAVELDSNFAMAHFRLGGDSALEKAWQLRKKVTEKERLFFEAEHAGRVEKNPTKATEIYEELLKKYPYEMEAYYPLADIYMGLCNFEKGVQTYLTGLKYDSLYKTHWNSLAYLYAGLGRKKEALAAIDRYLRLAPAEPNPYDSRGDILYLYGEVDSAASWYQKAVVQRSDYVSNDKLGNIALVRGEYAQAEKYWRETPSDGFRRVADSVAILKHKGQFQRARKMLLEKAAYYESRREPDSTRQFYQLLAFTAGDAGDWASMLEYEKKALALLKEKPDDKKWERNQLVFAYLKNGNFPAARRLLQEIRKNRPPKAPPDFAWFESVYALLALEEGKNQEALQHFEKALQPWPPKRGPYFPHGIALFKVGRLDEAIGEFERSSWWGAGLQWYINMSFVQRPGGWAVTSVKARYWLGRAYEQKGDKEKAIKEYGKFLEIWKDADFNSPEMADAKQRLARLKTKT